MLKERNQESNIIGEIVTLEWQNIWKRWGEKVGLTLTVSDFPDSEEVRYKMKLGAKPIYIPPELSNPDALPIFARMWPKTRSYLLTGNLSINENVHSGWRYVESTPNIQYEFLSEVQLKRFLQDEGREGLTLNEYIIASEHSKISNGKFFDENGSWTRLLSSNIQGKTLSVGFYPEGDLRFGSGWNPDAIYPYVGGRSSQAIGA